MEDLENEGLEMLAHGGNQCSQTKDRMLMTATGTASARSVRCPSEISRTPRSRAVIHSRSSHPPSGPIHTAASAGTGSLLSTDKDSTSACAPGSTSISRNAGEG